MTTITALPNPPSTNSPSTFDSLADNFIAALPTFVTECNLVASEVNTAKTNAETAETNAEAARDIATAAAATCTASQAVVVAAEAATIALYDNFDDRYLGPKAVAPTLDNDGNALIIGALYFHTAGGNPGFRVWGGAAWIEPAGTVQPDFNILRETATATGGQTVFNLGNTYVPGTNSIMVYKNGVRLLNADYAETSSSVITLNTGATAGDELLFEIGVAVLGAVQTATNTNFTPTGSIASTNVQAALAELDGDITSLTGTDIAFTPVGSIASTNVQAALAEIDGDVTTLAAGQFTRAQLHAIALSF